MKKLICTAFALYCMCAAIADDRIVQFICQGFPYSYRISEIDSISYNCDDRFPSNYRTTKSIHLSADDGTNVWINLSNALTIKFDADNLIASDGEQTVTIGIDQVKIEYCSYYVETGIADVQTQADYTISDGAIVFQDLKVGQTVRVFSVDGKLLMTVPANSDGGKTCIELSTLPKGISIIQAGKFSLKYSRN